MFYYYNQLGILQFFLLKYVMSCMCGISCVLSSFVFCRGNEPVILCRPMCELALTARYIYDINSIFNSNKLCSQCHRFLMAPHNIFTLERLCGQSRDTRLLCRHFLRINNGNQVVINHQFFECLLSS